MNDFARPEALVDAAWALAHLEDPNVRFVEVDVDLGGYEEGHIPGAIAWNWTTELCDQGTRDVLAKDQLEALLSRSGITRETTIVLYGDNNNWFAAWAFWQLVMYGHPDVRILDGGRKLWLATGHPLTFDVPEPAPSSYVAKAADASVRALLDDVRKASASRSANLVDVRSPAEFSGQLLAPPGLPETCQRGGHIPGASSVPWAQVCNEDGTFKSRAQLRELYAARGVHGDKPVIAYCRIGERSSHTWFALKYLLGFDDVRNYDGSWTEWGNLVGAPIER